MKDLNTKQAKTELGDLIFLLGQDRDFAMRKIDENTTPDQTAFIKLCQTSFDLKIIKLYEDFGIAYYDEEIITQDYLGQRDLIQKEHDQAYQEWIQLRNPKHY